MSGTSLTTGWRRSSSAFVAPPDGKQLWTSDEPPEAGEKRLREDTEIPSADRRPGRPGGRGGGKRIGNTRATSTCAQGESKATRDCCGHRGYPSRRRRGGIRCPDCSRSAESPR